MFPDRALQLKILEELKTHYPERVIVEKLSCYSPDIDLMANMFYLRELGIIDGEVAKSFEGIDLVSAVITWRGIDFLEDDGGVSAILNKVVVKFDEEDLTKILTMKLAQSDLSPEDKKSVMKTIKSLPAEGIMTVYTHLLTQGLKSLPDVPQLIQHIKETLL